MSTVLDIALLQPKRPGYRVVCGYCRRELLGDHAGTLILHRVCQPLCAEAKAAGQVETVSPISIFPAACADQGGPSMATPKG